MNLSEIHAFPPKTRNTSFFNMTCGFRNFRNQTIALLFKENLFKEEWFWNFLKPRD